MILTDKEKMIVTPTYHVFEMFKVHQGATSLPVTVTTPDYAFGDAKIPAVSVSASRAQDGKVHVSLANCDPHRSVRVDCKLAGVNATGVSGRVLTAGEMNAHNTFAEPDAVKPAMFDAAKLSGESLSVELPAKSVVMLALQ
jgi:alpha-N-arabinofuranosidase